MDADLRGSDLWFTDFSKGGKFVASCGRSTVKKLTASPDPQIRVSAPEPLLGSRLVL